MLMTHGFLSGMAAALDEGIFDPTALYAFLGVNLVAIVAGIWLAATAKATIEAKLAAHDVAITRIDNSRETLAVAIGKAEGLGAKIVKLEDDSSKHATALAVGDKSFSDFRREVDKTMEHVVARVDRFEKHADKRFDSIDEALRNLDQAS